MSSNIENNQNEQFNVIPLENADITPSNDILAATSNQATVRRKRLSILDRFLTIWILLAMVVGVLVGYLIPNSDNVVNSWTVGSSNTNIPIAIGLILMMWPPLARVKYNEIGNLFCRPKSIVSKEPIQLRSMDLPADNSSRSPNGEAVVKFATSNQMISMLSLSLVLNWIVGPLLMFGLATATLPDKGPYLRGLIYTGLARCIAMVIVWNTLSEGHNEFVAILVALNSLFQLAIYSPYAYLFTAIILPSIGIAGSTAAVSFWLILVSVLIYLGIPFLLGFSCWLIIPYIKSREWYETRFIPIISPITLFALLFTIVFMFCLKGHLIISIPLEVLRIIVPLLIYFALMFGISFFLSYYFRFPYAESVSVAFTAASNNFELSIAVSVSVFGLNSGEAFACVIGPLVEVPVMLALVHVALWAKPRWHK